MNQQSKKIQEKAGIVLIPKRLTELERRRDYLLGQIDDTRISASKRGYIECEYKAICAGIVALKFHQHVVSRLDEPLSILTEIVEAYDGPANQEARVRAAVRRARPVIEEFRAMLEAACEDES